MKAFICFALIAAVAAYDPTVRSCTDAIVLRGAYQAKDRMAMAHAAMRDAVDTRSNRGY